MANATQVLPSSTVTSLPSGSTFAATGFPDIPVFMGPSSKGPLNAPRTIGAGDLATLTATFGTGSTVKRAARAMSLVAQQIVFVRTVTASVAGVLGTVTAVLNGSSTITHTLSGTPTDGADIVIDFVLGGTTGTGPIDYQVSLDGGTTFGSTIHLTTGTSITVLGVTVALGSGHVATTGDTLAWLQTVASSTVLPLDASHFTGTGSFSVSGTPNDAYEVRLEFRGPGTCTVGTALAGFQYRYALDAGASNAAPTFGPWTNLSTSTSIVLVDGPLSSEPTGLTVTLPTTILPGDYILFATSSPAYDSAGITAATTALAGWKGGAWSWVRFVGPITEALGGTVSTIVAGWETGAPGPKWGIVDGRDRATYETLAAWSGRVGAEWLPFFSTWVGFSLGMARESDGGINGRRNRAPAADAGYVPRFMGLSLQIDPGEFDLGPLGADVSISDANQVVVEHDANSDPSLQAIGALTLRQWPGETGIYPTGALLPGPANDIQRIPLRRVENVAEIILRRGQVANILKPLRIIPSGSKPQKLAGYPQLVPGADLENADIAKINRVILAMLKAGIVATGYAPDIAYQVNQTPTQLGGGAIKLTGACKINGFVYPVTFIGTTQFVA